MALTWLEICGFRSYAEPQRFDFDGVLTVVDGANSQGKTSTAEAITVEKKHATRALRAESASRRWRVIAATVPATRA